MDSQDSPQLGVGEATTFPLTVYSMPGHKTNTQMSFCPGTPTTLGAHNFVCRLMIDMKSKSKL
jgi:hypothetical protein